MCCLDYENIKDISIENIRQLAKEYWNRADLHEKNGPAADSFVMFLNRVKEFLASYQQYPDHTVFFGHGMWIGLLACAVELQNLWLNLNIILACTA